MYQMLEETSLSIEINVMVAIQSLKIRRIGNVKFCVVPLKNITAVKANTPRSSFVIRRNFFAR